MRVNLFLLAQGADQEETDAVLQLDVSVVKTVFTRIDML